LRQGRGKNIAPLSRGAVDPAEREKLRGFKTKNLPKQVPLVKEGFREIEN